VQGRLSRLAAVKPVVIYSLVRLGIFAVLIVVLVPLFGALPSPIGQIAAAIVAAVIALCLSYLVLGRQRGAVAVSIDEARATRRERTADELAEDDAVEENDALEGDRGTER
jgi:hypothetical protein